MEIATEASLREILNNAVWIIGALIAALTGIATYVYLSGEQRVKDQIEAVKVHLSKQDEARERDQQEVRAALSQMKDAHTKDTTATKDLIHELDKRMTRIEDRTITLPRKT